ncbi:MULTISPECIES: alpha-amylase family glycosyl hydrolase [unclassified Spirosoma]|uniref:alpha-amylase family glycosyl hydrolase n=1 Tax=unclassified Spirosoma TaxID=2621999 RepID=UPI000965B998|nr:MULTISPECIES: alpha-amylase family glycosyl hydrolase [unclassified Spirosoma]MBN8826941.1 alpha-amylase [Spirosoma sp.]OJW70670.1 MAG: alpha-amylase [Spirosoma sp. 48-14]
MYTASAVPVMDKLIIYQIFTRLFGNQNTTNHWNGTLQENGVGKFNDINNTALQAIKQFGATHIWFTGIIEHATQTDYSAYGIRPDDPVVVKGRAGSPYAVKDYYDVDPDLAVSVPDRMAEFDALIQRTHAHNLKVIIDFVPNHVARQYQSDAKPAGVVDLGQNDDTTVGFSPSNNFYYLPGQTFQSPEGHTTNLQEFPAKVTGSGSITASPDINDWYETVKLNYGINVFDGSRHFDPIPATWNQMLDILLFWSAKGVDGFRCDMAHLVPVEFWQWAISRVKRRYPHMIFIAEIYDPGLYRPFIFVGGFDYLYDKVGLYDSVRRLMEGHGSCYDLTRVWQQESGDFAQHMLRFLETHDEQRIASRFFANDPWAAVPAMTLTATMHTGPVLIYFGQEVGVKAEGSEGFSGDDGRTTIFDYWGMPRWQGWLNGGNYDGGRLTDDQRNLRAFYQQLNYLVMGSDAIQNGYFYDLQYVNDNGQSPGYDAHQIYSYLRYTDRQKLLIVCNFSAYNTYDTTIQIPQAAFGTMGLTMANTYKFMDIFLTDTELEVVGSAGVPVLLPPRSVRVLEIKS